MIQSYHITRELAGFSRRRLLFAILFAAVISIPIYLACVLILSTIFQTLRHTSTSGTLLRDWKLWLFWPGIFAPGLFLLLDKMLFKSNLGYDVIVSDDRIIARYSWIEASVERKDLRTVYETKGNILAVPTLRLSNHGRFGAAMGGVVVIPRALPEYASIRDLALSWKSSRKPDR
jgi:hypothetical protein